MKMFVFWIQFHWRLFQKAQLTITSIGLDNGLVIGALLALSHYLIHLRIYAALGEDESMLLKDFGGFIVK